MKGGRIQIPLQAGHHRPASETPFKWRFAGVLMMPLHGMLIFQGIWTRIAKKLYIFVIFQRGRGSVPPVPPSGSAHVGHIRQVKENRIKLFRVFVPATSHMCNILFKIASAIKYIFVANFYLNSLHSLRKISRFLNYGGWFVPFY